MTLKNIDEMILFVLRKHGYGLMLFAISRYIRVEFDRDINSNVLLARLNNMIRKKMLLTRSRPMIKGFYYKLAIKEK